MTSSAPVVIIGAGIAGASTAAALARAGVGPGVILEREPVPGAHASGRNAGIARVAELDPVVRGLAMASAGPLARLRWDGQPVLRPGPGLYLADAAEAPDLRQRLVACAAALGQHGLGARVVDADALRQVYPFLGGFAFDHALVSEHEGVLDIHALLSAYLSEARGGGFEVLLGAPALALRPAGSRLLVETPRGAITADVVVDAGGAWAGRLGRAQPLPLQPLRRHLFTSGPTAAVPVGAPLVWHLSRRYYLRPEGPGLLLSGCDESPHAPGVPEVDPAVRGLLAERLLSAAPGLAELPVRACWACLRTFAPDRRPVIGPDPDLPGLFHVSALGGFGMGTSWAVGEVAAALIRGAPVPLPGVDPADLAPRRVLPG